MPELETEIVSERFPRSERLKDKQGIAHVFRGGERFSTSGARLSVARNGLSYNRVLFATARNYGNAVRRNRAKRVGRAVYRHIRSRILNGRDIAFLLYPGSDTYCARYDQMMSLMRKAGLAQ